jgi:hypothetical protein
MATIRHIDFVFLDELLDTGSGPGYVLNFSDKTFAQFFADELDIDIDDAGYSKEGTSKGKRLRYFLKVADTETAVRTLTALWEYRVAVLERFEREDTVKNAHGRLLDLIDRLRGNKKPDAGMVRPAFNTAKLTGLKEELTALASVAPQPRGYLFESFLKSLFDAYDLKAREPFRLVGEQIDGSFDLGNETYLLEAKWHNELTPAADLHVLQGKLEQKAAWARGLFVSYSGFTEDGLNAFGRGKRVVCMDGRDIWEALERQLPLNHVLEQKVRRAAETGSTFVRVSDLFR